MIEVGLSAVILGLLGAGHCLGMCGGFAAALAYAVPETQAGKRFALLLAYNLGRVASYALAGAAVAYAQNLMPDASWPLARTLAGLLLIGAGLYLADIWRGITVLERLGKRFWQKLQPISQRLLPVTTLPKALLLGAVWGWLPCGLVYSVLALAATQPSATGGALVMAAFGLGTIPAVLGGGLAANRLRGWLVKKSVRWLLGLSFVVFGLWTIAVPWYHLKHHGNHHGNHHGTHHGEHADHSQHGVHFDQHNMHADLNGDQPTEDPTVHPKPEAPAEGDQQHNHHSHH